jgi:leucyl aminopeptidase (aminopeptidase T)
MRQVALRVVRQCLKVTKGEKVLVEALHLDDLTLPEFLTLECVNVGAHPVLVVRPENVLHSKLTSWNSKDLEHVAAHELSIYRNCDVRISVYSCFYPHWWQSIEGQRKAALDRSNQMLTNIIIKRKTRNLNVSIPTEKETRERKLDYTRLLDEFITAVNVDYEKMRQLANMLRRKLEKHSEIQIESDEGTNLSLKTSGRTFLVEDGVISEEDMMQGVNYAEIPGGEVFVAPLEDGADGTAVIPSIPGVGRLKLHFKRGRVVDATGERRDVFCHRLKQATGEKDRIAEFAIGLNPGAPSTNEKALGSIHIAIGKNNHIGGKNESSLHWDMIMPRTTVKADGELIVERGHILDN